MSKTTESSGRTITVSAPELPVCFTLSAVLNDHFDDLAIEKTDLLVLTHMAHTKFGRGMQVIDQITAGAISSAIDSKGFTGEVGQHLLIACSTGPVKNVLLIGIGGIGQVLRPTICGMFRLMFDEARRIDATKLTLPVFPGLLFGCNLRGLLAVLQCRILQTARAGELGLLNEIEILSTYQARPHILAGLNINKQLCPVCRDFRLQQGEKR